jgi:hypothetical protein
VGRESGCDSVYGGEGDREGDAERKGEVSTERASKYRLEIIGTDFSLWGGGAVGRRKTRLGLALESSSLLRVTTRWVVDGIIPVAEVPWLSQQHACGTWDIHC